MQNVRTYCIPLGEVKSDDVVARSAWARPIFMGASDATSFAGGYFYDPSDIDSWVEFTLPPPVAGNNPMAPFKTGGGDRFPVAAYDTGLSGGVAPPEGTRVFTPYINLPDLPAVEAGGSAYGPNYAIFVKVSGSNVYPTYEPPMFGDGVFSFGVRFGPELYGFVPTMSGSFYADPGTDLKILVATGFAPLNPVDEVSFWTNFRHCKEVK